MLAADSRRPHDQIVRTVCGACPAGCGVKFYVRDGRVVDLLGDEDHPVNRGALCARGSAFFQHFDHPARLRQPALRHALDQEFTPAGWDEALTFAAGRLKAIVERHGPSAVAVATADALDVGNCVGAARFAARLGARLIHPPPASPGSVAAEMAGAEAAARLPVPPDEWAHSGCLLLLGGDPAVEYPIAFRHVLEARARRVPVIAAAPRYTATLSRADFAFRIRPGSEVAFLLALAKVACEEGLPGLAEAPPAGLEAWRAATEALSWEALARLTWLPEPSLRRAGLVWAGHQPGLIVGGGVVSPNLARAAVGLLALGGVFASADGREGRLRGGWNWLATAPWPFVPDGSAPLAAGEATPVKAVVGTGNFWPWIEAGGPAEVEFVAHFGAYPDESYRRAHVTLPAASWAEVAGLHLSHDRRVQWHIPAVAPPGQARGALDFWARLADRLGLDDAFPWRTADGRPDVRACAGALLAQSPLAAGLTLADLDAIGGARWPLHTPAELGAATPLSLGPPPEVAVAEPTPARPFLLVRDTPAGGDAAWWPWLHAGQERAALAINPATAAALGIENDDALVVDDGRRHFRGRAVLTEAVPPRAIWASAGPPLVAPVRGWKVAGRGG